MAMTLTELSPADPESFYLRPVPLAGPPARAHAVIAGGWCGFDLLEVLARDHRGLVTRAMAPVDEVRLWARHHGREAGRRVEALLARITAPRTKFANLALTRPVLMGVVNVTPDSFSDGGDFARPEAALDRARALVDDGAAILDIGGESTRPGSDPVDATEELRRTLPVLKALAADGPGARISIDTRKAEVMAAAVDAGAHIVNDVSALTHEEGSLATVGRLGVPVVLMHLQGDPKTMQEKPSYGHAPTEIFDHLALRIQACEAAGIPRDRIAVDPGIGFGKSLAHNLAILGDVALYHGLGCPLVLGASRKSFIGHLTGVEVPKERAPGSLAAALWCIGQGAQIVRVHDVAATRQALTVWQGIASGGN